jgi:meckelin
VETSKSTLGSFQQFSGTFEYFYYKVAVGCKIYK